MSDELMLKCLIAFILGYFLCKMMGNGFSVGGAEKPNNLCKRRHKVCIDKCKSKKPKNKPKCNKQCKLEKDECKLNKKLDTEVKPKDHCKMKHTVCIDKCKLKKQKHRHKCNLRCNLDKDECKLNKKHYILGSRGTCSNKYAKVIDYKTNENTVECRGVKPITDDELTELKQNPFQPIPPRYKDCGQNICQQYEYDCGIFGWGTCSKCNRGEDRGYRGQGNTGVFYNCKE